MRTMRPRHIGGLLVLFLLGMTAMRLAASYVSLVSGGVILTGFGAYTPMLSSDLKLGLSDMAGQIETGGMVISTPFDV